MNRRDLLKSYGAVATFAAFPALRAVAAPAEDAKARLAALEAEHGGRLGVAIHDTGGGRPISHRGHERFLMCSTFKLPLVAAVLMRVDRGEERLDRRIVFDQDAILDWAPVTMLNVGAPGMTIEQLCEAATLVSDNTAANLLLETLGGPAGFTAFIRRLGDSATRLDHVEPLNNAQSGEQDTTTPLAMLGALHKLLVGDALSEASRDKLIRWITLNQTGAHGLEAGLPANWRIGDKTGSASTANNDIGIIWPPERAPVLVTAYYTNSERDSSQRKQVLMAVGSLVAATI